MSTLTERSGEATVTISGLSELESAFAKVITDETANELIETAERIASDARDQWYRPGVGVRRVTGRSGNIQALVEVSGTTVRVTVGSTDSRTKGGKPLPVFIHAPGPFSKRGGSGEFLLPKLATGPFRKAIKGMIKRIAAKSAERLSA